VKIEDNHKHHGAALTQIVECRTFKAINVLEISGKHTAGAFIVNNDIAVYMKTDAVGPSKGRWPEFKFTFSAKNVREVDELIGRSNPQLKVFIVLVCWQAKEICVISGAQFDEMVVARTNANGGPEKNYQILVQVLGGKWFSVYMNTPHRRGLPLAQKKIPRRDFPKRIFEA